jgi:hypothetical protein
MLTVTEKAANKEMNNNIGVDNTSTAKTLTEHVDKRSKDAVEKLQEVLNIKPQYVPDTPKVAV